MEDTNQQKQKFYEKKWFAWVMLVLLAPIGIALMFKYQHHTLAIRGVASAFFGIVFLTSVLSGSDEDEIAEEESETAEASNEANNNEPKEDNENNNGNENNNNNNEEATAPQEEEEDTVEEVAFSFDEAEYVEDTETFDIEASTNLPDGTELNLVLRDPQEEHFYNGTIESVEVEDGSFSTQLTTFEDDWDGPFPILNGDYELVASFSVNDSNNSHLLDTFGSYEEFSENYTIDAEVRETDSGYVVERVAAKEVTITEAWTEEEAAQAQAEYRRDNAETIDYAELEKNADAHFGEYVSYSGTILEIHEQAGSTQMRLALDDYANDVIFVEYDDYTDFIRDDKVTIYGEVYGNYSYTSEAGWEITLPAVMADHLE